MLSFCPAKINLGLWVTEKRSDGFHNIETIFYPIPWYDAIEVNASEKANFSTFGIPIPGEANGNLVWKAYQMLKDDFDLSPVHLRLLKNLPIGAGLGGGSSDGTETLLLLDQFFSLNLSEQQLFSYAKELGSDCSFFVNKRPVIARGKGDELVELNIDLGGNKLVLIYPNIHVSTPWAYSNISPLKREKELTDVIAQSKKQWQASLINDFEVVVGREFPRVTEGIEALINSGAWYAAMSGSGSSFFGLFENKYELEALEAKFANANAVVFTCELPNINSAEHHIKT